MRCVMLVKWCGLGCMLLSGIGGGILGYHCAPPPVPPPLPRANVRNCAFPFVLPAHISVRIENQLTLQRYIAFGSASGVFLAAMYGLIIPLSMVEARLRRDFKSSRRA